MKKDAKAIIFGGIAGFIIGSAITVTANTMIQAYQNDEIKVTLNGIEQTFRDATTNEIELPITFRDRTYLPLRSLATLVGLTVDYDDATQTAILKNENYEDVSKYLELYYKDVSRGGDYCLLPHLKFNTEDAKAFNEKMDSYKKEYLAGINTVSQGDFAKQFRTISNKDDWDIGGNFYRYSFDYQLYEDVLAIIINDGKEVYNFDINTGKRLTEIDEIVGNERGYKIQSVLTNHIKSTVEALYKDHPYFEGKAIDTYYYSNTNIIGFFVNAQGKAYFVFEVPAIAGGNNPVVIVEVQE